MEKNQRRSILSWSLMGALLLFCVLLGALQYRLISQVSVAARERLRAGLQNNLNALSRDFDLQILRACQVLLPPDGTPDAAAAESALKANWRRLKLSGQDVHVFRVIGLAVPDKETVRLRKLNPADGALESADWPAEWTALRARLERRLSPQARFDHHADTGSDVPVFEVPVWGNPHLSAFGRRETAWLIFELDPTYLRDVTLPAVIQRHLGSSETGDYQVEVVDSAKPGSIVYRSDAVDLTRNADASIGLFHAASGPFMEGGRGRQEHAGRPGVAPGTPPVAHGGPSLPSRWQIYVRNRAGSLEAVVNRARWVNLLVTFGILLLMLATIAALIRFTRRAQKLAELQLEFVANVSHELRTPLTVIHTAAYNLQGSVANQPRQVERYGAVIQKESGRLKDLVEQVLQFASANAGLAVREHEAVSVSQVIADAAQSVQAVFEQQGCVLHQSVEASLPPVLGDRAALKQAIQNLLSNAAKYGSSESKWVGVEASTARENDREMVEVRVQDRGPGIPGDEREHIFEPFFRGRWAVRNQVHGTGLGLNLVKRVVEAHHGSIQVKSEESHGTEFIVRLPSMITDKEAPYAHSAD
ncbi:MAG TPA: HAMP domain-containing sensor histidine kinase [Bryobacteraceae bacterium]|nr:HAMP domain-containing sensor histidine kinase [Bryobacteraceae bacterium]